MAAEKPTVTADGAHYLKGHASWLYCDSCNKTIAYLCYVTYQYFRFSFVCQCGSKGSVENRYREIVLTDLPKGTLKKKTANNRFCCEKDDAALFSPVPKNLVSYHAEAVCKECGTKYEAQETFA